MSSAAAFHLRELTARGAGGVSVLVLEGAGVLERLRRVAPACAPQLGVPVLARLAVAGEELDLALVVQRLDGALELHVTGSPPLVERLRAELDPGGLEVGPQSVEELARHLLASAACEAAARLLLDAAEGCWRAAVAELVALEPEAQARRAAELVERGRVAARCLVPTRLVLAGPVNAGKSTLFNALLGESRAIVSAEAGTTRDVLVGPAQLGAYPVLVHDAAGLRALPQALDSASEIERAGQALARAASSAGELVLWLEPVDAAGGPAPGADPPPAGALRVATKADLAPLAPLDTGTPHGVPLAAGPEPAAAVARVATLFRAHFDLPEEPWRSAAAAPFTARQRAALARLAAPGLAPAARAELLAGLLAVDEGLRSARPGV